VALKVFLGGEEIEEPHLFSLDEPPAFGQVWEFHGQGSMFLLHPSVQKNAWVVRWFHPEGSGKFGGEHTMFGLADNPSQRISGYRRLA